MMRLFLSLAWLLGAALLIAETAVAARGDGSPVVGVLAFTEKGCRSEPFMAGMRELGYAEGKTMTITCVHTNGQYTGLEKAAAELVRRQPDVIVSFGHATSLALKQATRTIPVVMSTSGEPVTIGMVQSLARPGGNITGVSYYNAELNAKRLELLTAVSPEIRRVALVIDPAAPPDLIDIYTRHTTAAAQTLGMDIRVVPIRPLAELEQMVKDMVSDGVHAIFVMPFQATLEEVKELAGLAVKYRLPTIHFHRRFVQAGGLMSYGVDYTIQHKRLAPYVHKILNGADPAQLPIEQPTHFLFVLNLKTAAALGITVPKEILVFADEVIQ